MTETTPGPAGIPSDIERGTALWTFISNRNTRFTRNQGIEVVQQLDLAGHEDPKALARRLRELLLPQGVALKHTHALDAAALILHNNAWQTHLRIAPPGSLNLFRAEDQRLWVVSNWRDASEAIVDACATWCAKHPASKLLRLVPNRHSITIVAAAEVKQSQDEAIFIITPNGDNARWMEGAAAVFETLRRRMEETLIAVVDGVALFDYCANAALESSPGSGVQRVHASDVVTSELVLMQDDHDMGPGSEFEMARGDEVYCWSQLERALEGKLDLTVAIDGAWHSGDMRFIWKVATIHPKDYVPGLTVTQNIQIGQQLFRRYKLAKRIIASNWPRRLGAKPITGLTEPASTCQVHTHKLLLAMKKAGLDWESYCAEVGETIEPKNELPMGFALGLIARLRPDNPNQYLASPPRASLSTATDDQLLRILMPRAQRAIYRLPAATTSEEHRAIIAEAVDEFSASLAIRSGAIPVQDQLPDVVYSTDGEDLRLKLEEVGFVVRVGLMPYLHKIPEEVLETMPEAFPYAFGHAIFLDIDHAA